MKKYQAVRDSVGFMGRRWRKDDIIDVADDVVVPHHFKLIGSDYRPPEPVKEVPVALSQLHKVVKPESGFGYQADEVAPKEPKTRGRKKKDVGSVKE